MDFASLSTDLDNHPITGWLPDGRALNIPLISHIVDNLYVGGCINGVDLGDYFSHVFSLYMWERYHVSENTKLTEWKMYDGHGAIVAEDMNENPVDLEEIVYQIVSALSKGGNVLVHCQAGINRSNLLATLVLRAWKNMSSREAIELLRERRSPLVLANKTFEDFLLSLS